MNNLVEFHESLSQELGLTPGWVRGEGSSIISQPKLGVEVVWVAWKNPEGKVLYDQILRAERPGAVFLPISTDGHVGLQMAFRPQARDQGKLATDFPNIDVSDLGRPSWEVPRGFSLKGETAKETTKREVESETQGRMISYAELSPVCDNTAFSPHMTHMSYGQVDLHADVSHPEDPLEVILQKLTFFSLEEIKELRSKSEIYCGYTVAALGSVLLEKPNLLK